jgi:hypothetical protein
LSWSVIKTTIKSVVPDVPSFYFIRTTTSAATTAAIIIIATTIIITIATMTTRTR